MNGYNSTLSGTSPRTRVAIRERSQTDAVERANQPGEPAGLLVREIGGCQQGLEPTRYGDWEKNGRCIDF